MSIEAIASKVAFGDDLLFHVWVSQPGQPVDLIPTAKDDVVFAIAIDLADQAFAFFLGEDTVLKFDLGPGNPTHHQVTYINSLFFVIEKNQLWNLRRYL